VDNFKEGFAHEDSCNDYINLVQDSAERALRIVEWVINSHQYGAEDDDKYDKWVKVGVRNDVLDKYSELIFGAQEHERVPKKLNISYM
jgi:hypothetical protein